MDLVAEGPHQVGLAAAGFAQQQEDPAGRQARRLEHPAHDPLERLAGARVDRLHVERVAPPDVVGVGERVEQLGKLFRAERGDARVDLDRTDPVTRSSFSHSW